MGPGHFGWGGWWVFPVVMPLVMIVVFVTVLYFIFGRGGCRLPFWSDYESPQKRSEDSDTAMELLNKRYAKGEITREEFEQVKKDIQS